ncbi:beta-lactamase/transpeptidase-like protein [Thozetella sp. PMI_491]|nr:beta-lactamase/transpeptidase-like protein [Thozetella sp. PMI_491]
MESGHNSTPASGPEQPLGGGASPCPLNEEFDKLVEDLLEEWHVPGLAIAVIDGDSTWTKGYGVAEVTSNTPVTPNTIFCSCSTTKAFTAATVAQLIDSGKYENPSFPGKKVDWKTPIADILRDDFVLQDDWATANLTLEDALSHRTGFPNQQLMYGSKGASVKSFVRALRHVPLNMSPRTRFQYTNSMYVAASLAIETLTSQSLAGVFHDWIWKPLGMDETYFTPEDAAKAGAKLAKGYYWDAADGAYVGVPYLPLKELTGDGAAMSSVHDYAKWIRALLNEDKVFSKTVHDEIKIPRIFDSPTPGIYDTPPAYALGWRTSSYKGHRIWTHNGGTDSFGAEVRFLPGLKFGIVIFANTATSSNYIGLLLSHKLMDDKIGLPQDKREDWPTKLRESWARLMSVPDEVAEFLFPDRPKEGLKPAAPLTSYSGTYLHPAFGELKVEAGAPPKPFCKGNIELWATRPTATWGWTFEFEHVSGEYWVAYSYLDSLPIMLRSTGRVQFKIASDGQVSGFEVEWDIHAPGGAGSGKFTFAKIA